MLTCHRFCVKQQSRPGHHQPHPRRAPGEEQQQQQPLEPLRPRPVGPTAQPAPSAQAATRYCYYHCCHRHHQTRFYYCCWWSFFRRRRIPARPPRRDLRGAHAAPRARLGAARRRPAAAVRPLGGHAQGGADTKDEGPVARRACCSCCRAGEEGGVVRARAGCLMCLFEWSE